MRSGIKRIFSSLCLSIVLFGGTSSAGESDIFHLVWKGSKKVLTQTGDMISVPELKDAVYDPSYSFLPVYPVLIRDIKITRLDIRIKEKMIMFPEELDMINTDRISTTPESKIKWLYQQGKVHSRVWIFPFIKDEESGHIYKILSFSLDFEKENFTSNREDQDPKARKNKTNSSVLSKGEWWKIGITESGVYKIDYDFLTSMGVNLTDIDPGNIRLFGNGGGMLPQPNYMDRPVGLLENSIYVSGAEDNRFDAEDYLLFYGEAPHKIGFDPSDGETEIVYEHNDYSDTTFYFLNISDEPGLRIELQEDQGTNHPEISEFDDLIYHETDQYNILAQGGSGSGREWYGEIFRIKTEYDFDFEVPGLAVGSELRIISSVLAKSVSPTSFTISLNGQLIGDHEMEPIYEGTYRIKGTTSKKKFDFNTSGLAEGTSTLNLTYKFNNSGGTGVSDGYLDFFNIWCKRELLTFSEQTIIRSLESLEYPFSTFRIRNQGNQISIWDITDPCHPMEQQFEDSGENIHFGIRTDSLRTLIMFDSDNMKTPYFSGPIANQDLHGMTTPELLIITHSNFISEANRLAIHREQQGISTQVVDVQHVFNEFSSGAVDVVAIRDFVKYLYDRNNRLKYLLLFGRGTYDYKNILGLNSSLVPIYQSRNSLHPIYSYASDDFYGFLDEDEGEWEETIFGEHTMDIGVGRLPVKDIREASSVVDKLIIYDIDRRSLGPWRNDLYFVADDGDGEDGIRHSRDADRLAVLIDSTYTDFNIGKIYVDAFPQNILPNMQEAPEVNDAINNAVKNGSLIINFTGHGNESQWTRENILNIVSINEWENLFRLPLLVTATCEFGRHDDPTLRSGAEFALISERGGAIGLVTTSRPVYSISNFSVNRSFYQHVFKKIDGKYQSLGEIFRKTKNSGSEFGPVNRNFSLLGDPSMKLAYPDQNIIIDKLNEQVIEDSNDTLKALKKVKLSGKVLNAGGQHLVTYNGILTASVYDKPEFRQTLGTQDPVMVYEEQNSLIFTGDVTIENGSFDLEFVVPKNISYKVGEGKISLYSIDESGSMDASGSNADIKIGSSTDNFIPDTTPPEITLYLEDSTFQEGEITSDHPMLIARIYDENGINIIENDISRGIVLELDEEREIIVNRFYRADLDDYKKGTLKYQLTGLEKGKHQVVLRVWDTYNNMSKATLEFEVGEKNEIRISKLKNYPNPFRDFTVFSFEHNRSGESLEITIDIYSTRGQLIKRIEGVTKNSEFRINDITWDGRGESGKKLESGIYIYRVFVRSLLDGVKNTANEKLVIIK